MDSARTELEESLRVKWAAPGLGSPSGAIPGESGPPPLPPSPAAEKVTVLGETRLEEDGDGDRSSGGRFSIAARILSLPGGMSGLTRSVLGFGVFVGVCCGGVGLAMIGG